MTRDELLAALLIERFGHLHAEWHNSDRETPADQLRIVIDNERRDDDRRETA